MPSHPPDAIAKTEEQVEEGIESKVMSGLKDGTLDKEKAMELEEEMEEAIKEGILVGVLEKDMDDSFLLVGKVKKGSTASNNKMIVEAGASACATTAITASPLAKMEEE